MSWRSIYYQSPDKYGPKGPYYKCNYLEYEGCVQGVKWLFSAKMSNDNVCVRFVRSYYGEEVHKCLARANLASKLMSCERLPGGWVVVIMEKVDGVMLHTPLSTSVRESIMEALDLMNIHNYVHGDFRKQNILVVNNRACILDFLTGLGQRVK